MQKIKEKIKNIRPEDIVCLYIILCPLLDIASFIFRNTYNTKISPATILRPVIPILVIIYLFIKKDKNYKKKVFMVGVYIFNICTNAYIFVF